MRLSIQTVESFEYPACVRCVEGDQILSCCNCGFGYQGQVEVSEGENDGVWDGEGWHAVLLL